MRGAATFQSLFSDLLPEVPKQEGKGRSVDLNARRDELILCRYYFYGAFTPYRYDLIIKTMSDEFFLSERRIQDVIAANSTLLRQFRQTPPGIPYLRSKYPHLQWRAIAAPVVAKAVIEL